MIQSLVPDKLPILVRQFNPPDDLQIPVLKATDSVSNYTYPKTTPLVVSNKRKVTHDCQHQTTQKKPKRSQCNDRTP